MQSSFVQLFPSEPLSATKAKFTAEQGGENGDVLFLPTNTVMESCMSTTLDATDQTQHMLAVVEQYVRLTIPKMEDGNNFGVTVQLALLKQINDAQEKFSKAIDDVTKYTSSRAEAVEKCKLPSESYTKTTTTSTSETKTSGDEPKNSKEEKTSTEEKGVVTTSTKSSSQEGNVLSIESKMRMDAVITCDVVHYNKLKCLLRACMTEYVTALDFLEKNTTKIAQPRGSSDGSRSAYSSMY